MEEWNSGIMERWVQFSKKKKLFIAQYSIIPIFQYSMDEECYRGE